VFLNARFQLRRRAVISLSSCNASAQLRCTCTRGVSLLDTPSTPVRAISFELATVRGAGRLQSCWKTWPVFKVIVNG